MGVLIWFLRLAFFLMVLWFALKNTAPVTVYLTQALRWEGVPLIVVMLICLVVGMLFGALALVPRAFLSRRQPPSTYDVKSEPRRQPRDDELQRADRLADVARRAGAGGDFDATQTRRR